jgi:protein-S-isoprenylcysteine O-methyltransferase Ste14
MPADATRRNTSYALAQTALLGLFAILFFLDPTVPIAVAAVVVVTLLLFKARFEEARLLARYPEYADYKKRTWGIVPGLR